MKYGTVCSGIEAPSVAWEPIGGEPVWFSEIEPFPKAVLAHHYPNVPDLGDMTKVEWDNVADVDLLIGGTPCQSFSVAGLRKGLADPRGNLALEFLKIVDRKRPRWLVWENVPGVLSSSGGRDFGAFVGGLAELGYGFCWRVLDAQYFGVPQRRRRVFLVGHSGGWAGPAAVLFERESLRGNPAPSREAGEGVADHVGPSITSSGPPYSRTCNERVEADALVAYMPARTLCPGGGVDETFAERNICDALHTSSGNGNKAPLVAFNWQNWTNDGLAITQEGTGPLDCSQTKAVAHRNAVRRLTPVECERLQGFPDNYTRIPYRNKPEENCPDGPRYKALGNSMAVPVVRWIGQRIAMVDEL